MNKKHLPLKLTLGAFVGGCVLLSFATVPQLQPKFGKMQQTAEAQKAVEQPAETTPSAIQVDIPTAADNNSTALRSPMMRVGEVKSVDEAPIIYGIHYPWYGTSALEPYEIYSFHGAETLHIQRELPKITYLESITATFLGDNLYCFSAGKVNIIDVKTGKIIEEDIPFRWENNTDIIPMKDSSTYDPTTGNIYMLCWAGEGVNMYKALIAWSPTTKEITLVGALSNTSFPQSMTATPDGKLYIVFFGSPKTSMAEVDKTNGQCTTITTDLLNGDSFNNAGLHSVGTAADYDTGMIYMIGASNDNGKRGITYLYRFDPKTAKSELLSTMPSGEYFYALCIPRAESNDAPGFVTDMSYADGKLNFTAPTKTYYTGKTLSGKLTATINVRGGNQITKDVQPGEKVSVDLPLPSGNQSLVEIAMSNDKGKSPFRRMSIIVDEDVPGPVNDLKFSLKDKTNEATITWSKPTTAAHGGSFSDENVRYRITRYPDLTVVAEGLTTTTFTDRLPATHAYYYYGVTSMNLDREGETAFSNKIMYGNVWEAPYTENFNTTTDFATFTTYNSNGGATHWQWDDSWNMPKALLYEGSSADYLVTPKANIKENIEYLLRFSIFFMSDTQDIEVLLGTEPTLTGKEIVAGSVNVAGCASNYNNPNEFMMTFHVDKADQYYMFIHSKNGGGRLGILRMDYDIYSYFAAPKCVDNLNITAGAQGALYNTVKFNAPTKTYNGQTLNSITRIEIYRDGALEPAKVFTDLKPGASCEWVDEEVRQGNVTYKIIPYNEVGRGEYIMNTNWVGLDTPVDVTNIKARMNENEQAEVTFDRVPGVGVHGGYVDPEVVTYQLYRYNRNNPLGIWWEPVLEPTKDLTIADTEYKLPSGVRQKDMSYKIVAINKAGESSGKGFGIIIGKPYKSPYTESWPNCETDKEPWCRDGSMYSLTWDFVDGVAMAVKPYDNDKGMLQWRWYDNTATLGKIRSPRINMTTVTEPEFSCMMWHGFEAEPEDLTLVVWANYDDEGWKEIGEVAYNNGMTGWGRYSVALEKGHKDVQLGFSAKAIDASAAIYLDLLKVDNALQSDVVAQSISIEKNRVEAGDPIKVTACVSNYGVNPAQNYKVELRRDTKVIQTVEGKPFKANNEMIFYNFEIPTSKTDAKETMTFDVVVSLDGDQNEENNRSGKVSAYVHGTQYPTPANLTGAKVDETVELAWDKPESSSMLVEKLESFEEYESFIIDEIGDWITYDGDGEPSIYLSTPEVPNAFQPQAWQVWEPGEASVDINIFPMLAPHSGEKILVAWGASDGSISSVPNDDWLISPEVKGGSDISFYLRQPLEHYAPAKFEVLYSTTDQDPIEFEIVGKGEVEDSFGYRFFEFTLPDDAKYFAIRSCSEGSYFCAMLDDLTFTPLNGDTRDLTFVGYNIYRDGVVIAENVKDCKYTDRTAHGVQTYHVSAVWNEGESNPIGGVSINASLYDTMIDSSVVVKGMQGAVYVKSAAGTDVSIVTTAGLRVFNAHVDTDAVISLTSGIYMVTAGGKTYKVVVK